MVGHTLTPSPTEQQKGSKGQITIIVVFCASLNNNKVESKRSDVPPLEQWLALTQKSRLIQTMLPLFNNSFYMRSIWPRDFLTLRSRSIDFASVSSL